jgi:hypothetical protein
MNFRVWLMDEFLRRFFLPVQSRQLILSGK